MLIDSQFPPVLLARATGLLVSGRIHFVKEVIGQIRRTEEEDFEVYRQVVLTPGKGQPEKAGAILEVTFKFARWSQGVNRKLSFIPIPLIVAQPGFRSKTWLTGLQSGLFKGVYKWDTLESAEKYWDSFPMRLMRRRSAEGTLSKNVRKT